MVTSAPQAVPLTFSGHTYPLKCDATNRIYETRAVMQSGGVSFAQVVEIYSYLKNVRKPQHAVFTVAEMIPLVRLQHLSVGGIMDQ